MTNFSKSINWYPNNVLTSLKEDEPNKVEEVTPAAMPEDTLLAPTHQVEQNHHWNLY